MRRFFAALALLGVLGCGASRIIVIAEIDSFMSESDKNPSYGPILAGLPPVTLPFGPNQVEIPEGLSDLADVESADLSVLATVTNRTGSGEISLRIYFTSPGLDPFPGEPAGVFTAVLAPDSVSVIEDTLELTEEVQMLFTEAEIQFAYELVVDGSTSTELVEGEVLIEEMTVRVVHDPNLGS